MFISERGLDYHHMLQPYGSLANDLKCLGGQELGSRAPPLRIQLPAAPGCCSVSPRQPSFLSHLRFPGASFNVNSQSVCALGVPNTDYRLILSQMLSKALRVPGKSETSPGLEESMVNWDKAHTKRQGSGLYMEEIYRAGSSTYVSHKDDLELFLRSESNWVN